MKIERNAKEEFEQSKYCTFKPVKYSNRESDICILITKLIIMIQK